jgi:hypothetical protein
MHFSPFLIIILSDYYSLLVSFISPCVLFLLSHLFIILSFISLSYFSLLFLSFISHSFSPLFLSYFSLISLLLCRLQQAGAKDEGLASYGAAQAEAATNVFHMVAIYDFTQAKTWAVELVLMELTGPLRSRGLFTRLRLGRWSWC